MKTQETQPPSVLSVPSVPSHWASWPKPHAPSLIDSEAAAQAGEAIAEALHLRRDQEHKDRWRTTWGSKTSLGLYLTLRETVRRAENNDDHAAIAKATGAAPTVSAVSATGKSAAAKVVIEVLGGVAYVESAPPGVEVEIIDHDNDAHA